jgi:hypothetical protein
MLWALASVTDLSGRVQHFKSSLTILGFFLDNELDLMSSYSVLKIILGFGCDLDINRR